MVIGSLRILVEIPGNDNLKGKRRLIKGLIERIRKRFNVSVSEIDNLDKHQLATIGVAYVTNDSAMASRVLGQIVEFVDSHGELVLLDYMIEML